jgi:hypothetical protein
VLLSVAPAWAKEKVLAKPPQKNKEYDKLTAEFLEFLALSQIDGKQITFPNDLVDVDDQVIIDVAVSEKKAGIDVNQNMKKTLNMNTRNKKATTEGDK